MSELLSTIVIPTIIRNCREDFSCPLCDEGDGYTVRKEIFSVKEYTDGIKAIVTVSTAGWSNCRCFDNHEVFYEDYTEQYLKDPQQLLENFGIVEQES